MNPKKLKTLKIIFGIVLIAIVVFDFLVHRHHPNFFWDEMPGFSAFYGFVSGVVIIVIAKIIAPFIGLVKKEDYYD